MTLKRLVTFLLLSVTVLLAQLMKVGAFTGIPACNNLNKYRHNRETTEVGAVNSDCDSEFDHGSSRREWLQQQGSRTTSALSLLMIATTTPQSAIAAPKKGAKKGGIDVSNQDLSGQDLSNKDFQSAIAKATNFVNATLQGAQFQGADLTGADFSGANIKGANFDEAVLDNAIFKDVVAEGANFGPSILDAKSLENADMTKAVWPSKYRIMICDDLLKGVNPTTGVDSKQSAFCKDRDFSG